MNTGLLVLGYLSYKYVMVATVSSALAAKNIKKPSYLPQWTMKQVRQIHGLLLDLHTGDRR